MDIEQRRISLSRILWRQHIVCFFGIVINLR